MHHNRSAWAVALLFISCKIGIVTCFVRSVGGVRIVVSNTNSPELHVVCDQHSSRHTVHNRASGTKTLRAALDVKATNRLELGTVVVASPHNYGHSTYRVRLFTFRLVRMSQFGE